MQVYIRSYLDLEPITITISYDEACWLMEALKTIPVCVGNVFDNPIKTVCELDKKLLIAVSDEFFD